MEEIAEMVAPPQEATKEVVTETILTAKALPPPPLNVPEQSVEEPIIPGQRDKLQQMINKRVENARKDKLPLAQQEAIKETDAINLNAFLRQEQRLLYNQSDVKNKSPEDKFSINQDLLESYIQNGTELAINHPENPKLRAEILAHVAGVTFAAEAVMLTGGTYKQFEQTADVLISISRRVSNEGLRYIDQKTDDLRPEDEKAFKALWAEKLKELNRKIMPHFLKALGIEATDQNLHLADKAQLGDVAAMVTRLGGKGEVSQNTIEAQRILDEQIDPKSYDREVWDGIKKKPLGENLTQQEQIILNAESYVARTTWITANILRSIAAKGVDKSRLDKNDRMFVFNHTKAVVKRQWEKFESIFQQWTAYRGAIELQKDINQLTS